VEDEGSGYWVGGKGAYDSLETERRIRGYLRFIVFQEMVLQKGWGDKFYRCNK